MRPGVVLGVLLVLAAPAAAKPARAPALWPFSAASPWNTALGSRAIYDPATAACSAQIAATPSADVNAAQYSHPVVRARATDPLTEVVVGGAVVATIRVPADATPAAGDDAHLEVVDPAQRHVDELYGARLQAGHWVAESHTRNRLRGPGVGTGGERAYGGSAIGGLIRTWELRKGRIRHALAFALPRAEQRRGFVWPATSEDSGALFDYRGAVPMGTLAAIPPAVDIKALGLSAPGLAVARALQNFGAYDVDSSSDLAFYAEPSAEPLAGPIRGDLVKLQRELRCVTNNTPATAGGGGKRRAPPPPPFR